MSFAHRKSVEQVETGLELAPKFDEDGLIPVVTTDHASGEVLMHAYMNREALIKTVENWRSLLLEPQPAKFYGARARPAACSSGYGRY